MSATSDVVQVTAAIQKALTEGLSITELLALVQGEPRGLSTDKRPGVPAAKPLTPEVLAALEALPGVFCSVVPKSFRLLRQEELAALMREREAIDTILKALGTRKDTGIREIVANHLDLVAEREGLADESTDKDEKGHYLVKVEDSVPGMDRAFVRNVQHGSPTLSSAAILRAYEDGEITREQYLAVTSQVRVFDEDKARQAARKDPSLLFALAKVATPGRKTGAITTAKR